MGVNPSTYMAHENGFRGLSRAAPRYAAFFKVSLDWLVSGVGPMVRLRQAPTEHKRSFQLVGYVGAGGHAHFFPEEQPLDEVVLPGDTSENMVAVEIRGDSLGSIFDRWLVLYDDIRRPMAAELLGRLCVLGLDDGRILIKKIQRSRMKGHYHLFSHTEDPILDACVEWAARVKVMMPR